MGEKPGYNPDAVQKLDVARVPTETTEVGGMTYTIDELRETAERLPVLEVPLADMKYAVGEDHTYWMDRNGQKFGPFQILQDWETAQKNDAWSEHVATIKAADISKPIWATKDGQVFDGMHRLTRAVLENAPTVKVRVFEAMPDREAAPLPADIAKRFVAGKIIEGAPVVHVGDKSTMYRCFERDESVPGVDHAGFRVDYRKYYDPAPERLDQLRFEYTQPDATNPEEKKAVAEMHLFINDPHTFTLHHRYVKPEFRTRSGVGTRLLKTTEGWLKQVAHESGEPVTVRLQTGQKSVGKWIRAMGYEVSEDQRELLEEIEKHPERFFEDQVVLSEESAREGVVKDPYLFRAGTEGRYTEDAVRLTFQKQIKGD